MPGGVNVGGLGLIFQKVLKKATGIYGTVLQLVSSYSGFKFGTANEIYQDASGHLVIVNPTTSKYIYIDGKDGINLYYNGVLHQQIRNGYNDMIYHIRMKGNKEVRFLNADNTKYGYIVNSGGAGVEGPIDFYNSYTTPERVLSLITGGIARTFNNGAKVNLKWVTEELTIAVGQGSAGVDTTAIVPGPALIHSVSWRVTQAPGGGATVWEACRKGSANQEVADAGTSVALNTNGNSVFNADGNMPKDSVQVAPVEITVTTDADVTVSDMKIRFVIAYEEVTNPTS